MRQVITYAIFLFFLSTCTYSYLDNKQIEEFNNTLGREKVKALDFAMSSFNKFLDENYSNTKTEKEKIIEFLTNYADTNSILKLKFDYVLNKKIIEAFESSNLRKEIWYYYCELDKDREEFIGPSDFNKETHENYDSLREFNQEGLYLKALLKINKPDSLLIEYIEMKGIAGDISSSMLINGVVYGLKYRNINYEILKRIIVVELYFDLILYLERK